MKSIDKTRRQTDIEKRMVWLLLPVVIAVFVSGIGGVIGFVAGGVFKDALGFEFSWWHGALIGLFAGTIIGIVGAIRTVRSIAQLAEASESFGLTPLSEESTSKVRDRIHRLLSDRVLFSRCYFKSLDGIHVVMGELSITPLQTTGTVLSRGTKPSTLQTCIYFQIEGFTFPAFELKPEAFMVRLLSGLAGVDDIDFDDSPLFSKKYFLESDSPEAIRQLFSKEVREKFEAHLGYCVIARGGQVILFKPNRICRKDQYDSFVSTGLDIISVLQKSAAH